jgi:hypothetical protein
MCPRIAAALSLLVLTAPADVDARADERIFDPYFWSHPRYIDPTYDFELPPKSEVAREEMVKPDPDQERGKSSMAPPKRDERPSGSRRRRR